MGRKKQSTRLQVCMNSLLVGFLDRSSTGEVAFQYSDAWFQHSEVMAISLSLPLRPEKYTGSIVYNYFENLLPDSPMIRKVIAEKVGANSSEAIDLLSVIGKDCVGALQFLPDNTELPTDLPDVSGKKVTKKQIESILNNLTVNPLGLTKEEDFRISVAGVQEKTALLKIAGQWYQPDGVVPTSHILKKSIGKLQNGIDMTQSVQNEWLCLKICQKLGLEVAQAEIIRFGDTQALAVERFDRVWSKDRKKLYRIPTEDICQALGVSSAKKYENEGGPGIPRVMELLNTSDVRTKDRKTFMKAQIIFHLLGAIDGHAKNFSIFLGPNGMHLTPIYDVLTAYPAFHDNQIQQRELRLAMSVGNNRKYKLRDIQRRHWYETADLAHFSREFIDDILDELDAKLSGLAFEKRELPADFPESILETSLKGVDNVKKRLRAIT